MELSKSEIDDLRELRQYGADIELSCSLDKARDLMSKNDWDVDKAKDALNTEKYEQYKSTGGAMSYCEYLDVLKEMADKNRPSILRRP